MTRGERRARTEKVVAGRQRIHVEAQSRSYLVKAGVRAPRILESGYWKKLHPWDCGQPRCRTCSWKKVMAKGDERLRARDRRALEDDIIAYAIAVNWTHRGGL